MSLVVRALILLSGSTFLLGQTSIKSYADVGRLFDDAANSGRFALLLLHRPESPSGLTSPAAEAIARDPFLASHLVIGAADISQSPAARKLASDLNLDALPVYLLFAGTAGKFAPITAVDALASPGTVRDGIVGGMCEAQKRGVAGVPAQDRETLSQCAFHYLKAPIGSIPSAATPMDASVGKLRQYLAGVSPQQMANMRRKMEVAKSYLLTAWGGIFLGRGLENDPPAFHPIQVASDACGGVPIQNAEYCKTNRTIYYDEVFLAAVMKRAAEHLHTDGDYAPITILAHEFGHAIADGRGVIGSASLYTENTADCIAGVISAWAQHDGRLDPGDLDEARFVLSEGADRTVASLDRQLRNPYAHGDAYQRNAAFEAGLVSADENTCLAYSRR